VDVVQTEAKLGKVVVVEAELGMVVVVVHLLPGSISRRGTLASGPIGSRQWASGVFFSYLLLSSLEFSDTKVYAP